MRNILLLIPVFFIFPTKAADKKFPASTIPAKLLKNANVVKRMGKTEFTILNTGSTILKLHYALTILNENGDSHASLEVYYDKLRQVNSIEGSLYDSAGNLLKKLKNKDIKDVSAVDDISLMDDGRKKVHQFYSNSYPYTIEYEIEEKFNNTFFFPTWLPQGDEDYSVEESSYSIIFPDNYQIRYRAFNYEGEPAKSSEKGKINLIWKVNNVAAIKEPFATPTWRDLATVVYFAPTNFEIEGYKGNMETWKDFGLFQSSLNAGRDELPQNVIEKVNSLTTGITDVKEKIKILYNYLQQNTHYISIQLGIGGWQPFDASFVAKKGYGDCKALANYMHSLLKAAGIPSNYTIVNAGSTGYAKSRLIEDFPSNQFNHVIICVPLQKDSVWLECTNQNLPAGYMSDFTANRKALMITKDGGFLVSTPRYGINENEQIRTIKATLDNNGLLNMNVKTAYKCIQQDRLSYLINALSKEKVQKLLDKEIQLATYEVNQFKYTEKKTSLPEIAEQLNITVDNYATITGKRIFLTPNILNRSQQQLTEDTSRTAAFVFDKAYRDTDQVEISIPDGYELEAAPKNVSLKTKFGTYIITSKLEGNKILYTRTREQFTGSYPAGVQKELVQFYNDIYKGDRGRIVLVKSSVAP
ncbi:MAG: DUF3857 domain-containing protein [Ginsengibacter sp.]